MRLLALDDPAEPTPKLVRCAETPDTGKTNIVSIMNPATTYASCSRHLVVVEHAKAG
jgi:hypothetical protein